MYQFLQTWTGRWCLLGLSLIAFSLIGLLAWFVSPLAAEWVYVGAVTFEASALTALLIGPNF